MKAILIFISTIFFSLQALSKPDPLIGSHWAKKHPNELPFTQCKIFLRGYTAGFIKSVSKVEAIGHRQPLLECRVRPMKHAPKGLQYSIPLGDISIESYGVILNLGFSALLANVHFSNGNAFHELFNIHKGTSFNLNTGVGINFKGYGKTGGILFSINQNSAGAGLEIGKSSLKIKPRGNAIKMKNCLDNNYIIDANTSILRDQNYCDGLKLGDSKKIFFNSSEVNDFTFVYKP